MGHAVLLVPQVQTKSNNIPQDLVYKWSPSIGLSCADCKTPISVVFHDQTYRLTTIQNGTCEVETITRIYVDHDDVYIPNAFSPNGKGPEENEQFKVYGQGILKVEMMIFNRSGERVYTEMSSNPAWDGKYRGEFVQDGVYVYTIEITFLGGQKARKHGSVTVLR
ncbi:MAG: gliding motility-associated C-terminal domain-containing protein [Bacteroidetes bacterium]|nr:gliding motility-associated C-terminal domain-containing protein [Bacteroidota bacterium]